MAKLASSTGQTKAFIADNLTYIDGVVLWKDGRQPNSVDKAGYLYVKCKIFDLRLHLVAWFLHYNHWPVRKIEHLNGNRQDNRIENLSYDKRLKGVSFSKSSNKWITNGCAMGVKVYLGSFNTKEEAIAAKIKFNIDYNLTTDNPVLLSHTDLIATKE